jgi:hypothetical protein
VDKIQRLIPAKSTGEAAMRQSLCACASIAFLGTPTSYFFLKQFKKGPDHGDRKTPQRKA